MGMIDLINQRINPRWESDAHACSSSVSSSSAGGSSAAHANDAAASAGTEYPRQRRNLTDRSAAAAEFTAVQKQLNHV